MPIHDIIPRIKTKIAYFYLRFGKLRGSFLLEIAIAVSIIGLVSGFFVTKMITTGKIMRDQITKSNIETVSIALASFVANNQRLPRPSVDESGDEKNTPEMTYVGKVPFHTLGIPMKSAADGNGKPLIYIVEATLTSDSDSIYSTPALTPCFCKGIPNPKILIKGMEDFKNGIIAFVIDTDDNPPTLSGEIRVKISKNTFWISRDGILMRFLKNSPCERENSTPPST
ncbi:MAG: hypothetical protein LBJ96_05825, partial [Holosporaceae bacterium]|nr:hypothetical protein [Holosporaceae bacterium]